MISIKEIRYGLVFTFVVIILSLIYIKPEKYDKSKFSIFVKMISGFAIILVSLGLILTAQAFEENATLNRTNQTLNMKDHGFLKPIDKMNELFDRCPNFIESLWPQKDIFKHKKYNIEDDKVCILSLSIYMLESMEDHFTVMKFDKTDELEWTASYLQWASSDDFYKAWKEIYPNFKSTTNKYAKLLFEYARESPITNGKELQDRANKLMNDNRFKEIINEIK
jgi:hypothetical protein